jgi:hypothetical protein
MDDEFGVRLSQKVLATDNFNNYSQKTNTAKNGNV